MGVVRLLVGTLKGAFFVRAPAARTAWQVTGPYLPGQAVYTLAYDGRAGRRRIWASAASMHWGAVLVSTDDWGETWTSPREANVKFPLESGLSLKQIWQVRPGRVDARQHLRGRGEQPMERRPGDAGARWCGDLDLARRQRRLMAPLVPATPFTIYTRR